MFILLQKAPKTGRSTSVALVTTHSWVAVSTSVINSAIVLAEQGYDVDLFVVRSDRFTSPSFDHNRINVIVCNPIVKFLLSDAIFALRQRITGNKYSFIIGFDPGGLIRGGMMSYAWGTPLVFHSLELASIDEHATPKMRFKKAVERWFSKKAVLSLVQDDLRAEILADENGLDRDKIAIAYNSPIGEVLAEKKNYFRSKFSISKNKHIVLAVGSLITDHLIDRIVFSAHKWPDDWVLVLHGWFPDSAFESLIRSEVLKNPDKVFLSTEMLDYKDKYIVYESVDVGLVFFDPKNANLKYAAGSAGKLFDFMRAGVPIIGNDIPRMRELVEGNKCGLVVEDADKIAVTLPLILQDYEEFRQAAFAAYDKYRFDRCYEKVIANLRLSHNNFCNNYASNTRSKL